MLAEHADRFHAVIHTRRLRELGFDAAAVRRRVLAGRLHRWYPGVYAIGRRTLTPEGRWLAAVLACGERAVLSHRSAAALWGFAAAAGTRPDVTVAGAWIAGPAGIRVHRSRTIAPHDTGAHRRVPVTSVARTLADLAEVERDDAVARAVHEAEVAGLLDVAAVREVAARLNGRRRVAALVALLDEPAPPTASELERRFLAVCSSLPRPEVNVMVCGYRVDFVWPDRHLIVETDGVASHLTRRGFERDRIRDATLTAAGWRVVRVTWRRLLEDPDGVLAQLRQLLAA